MAGVRPNLDGPSDLQGPRLHVPEALFLGMEVSLPKTHPIITDFKSDTTPMGLETRPHVSRLRMAKTIAQRLFRPLWPSPT